MTMSGNTMIPGATALVYMSLAEMQGYLAQMQKDNLSLFTGSTGPDGERKAGYFEVAQVANEEALKTAQDVAAQNVKQGWLQFGQNMGAAVTQAAGLVGGFLLTKGAANEADQLESGLLAKQNGGMKVTATDVTNNSTATASVTGSIPKDAAVADNNTVGSGTGNASSPAKSNAVDDDKRTSERIAQLRNTVANQQTYYNTFATVANNALTGSLQAAQGYTQASITKEMGMQNYLQNTPQMVQQSAGVATAAIQAQQNAEQSIAQAYQNIISLTGSARG
jgi:hypothetical protein